MRNKYFCDINSYIYTNLIKRFLKINSLNSIYNYKGSQIAVDQDTYLVNFIYQKLRNEACELIKNSRGKLNHGQIIQISNCHYQHSILKQLSFKNIKLISNKLTIFFNCQTGFYGYKLKKYIYKKYIKEWIQENYEKYNASDLKELHVSIIIQKKQLILDDQEYNSGI
ncbi:hypothetical protein pb186bvf_016674 [Paramecium bursaria]